MVMQGRKSTKNLSIQQLRAFAVIIVLLHHFNLGFSYGYFGVDIFFVISGFVITNSFLRQVLETNKFKIIDFFIRRIARLFPTFLLVNLVTIFFVVLFYSPNTGIQQNALISSLSATFGVSNFLIPQLSGDYFNATNQFNPFLHTWSLSVEEQFYFVFPFLFILLLRLNKSSSSGKKASLFLIGLIACSFLLTFDFKIGNYIGTLGTTKYFSPQVRIWEFLSGALLSLNTRSDNPFSERLNRNIRNSLFVLLIFFCNILNIKSSDSMPITFFPVVATLLFLYFNKESVGNDFKASSIRQSSKKISIALGNSSYSIYLWHWPVYVTLNVLFEKKSILLSFFALLITALLSTMSYKYVEERFNTRKYDQVKFWVYTFIVSQLLSGVILGSLLYGVSKGWGQSWALNSHKAIQLNCDEGNIEDNKCSWFAEKSRKRIVLAGDSLSWAIADGFLQVSKKDKYNLYNFSRNGCPAGLLVNNDDCGVWQNKLVSKINQIQPDLVVLANSANYEPEVLRSIGDLVKMLIDSDIKTTLILPPPGGDEFSRRRALFFAPGRDNRTSPLPERIKLIDYGLTQSDLNKRFFLFDPAEYLCFTSCIIAKDGFDFYNYGQHLSVYGNKFLEPSIQELVSKILKD